MQHQHDHAKQSHSKASMCWSTVTEEVDVGFQTFWVKTFLLGLFDKNLNAVLSLSTGRDFGSTPD
jgi:hypothetical protein